MTDTAASMWDAHDLSHLAGFLLACLRGERTRVHAVTNAAAQSFTANLLLAAGGVPSLTTAPEEVVAFTKRSDALLVNLGTLDADRREAIPQAISAANACGKPWVLDPVFVDASPPRLDFARTCLACRPWVLRCNAGEFAALAGHDATAGNAQAFALAHQTVVALTGETDLVTDGRHIFRVHNGHPLMANVTAMGCAGTALIAAFITLHGDTLESAAAALVATGVAGEIAAGEAKGPGTFQPAYLDAVFNLDAPTLGAYGRFS